MRPRGCQSGIGRDRRNGAMGIRRRPLRASGQEARDRSYGAHAIAGVDGRPGTQVSRCAMETQRRRSGGQGTRKGQTQMGSAEQGDAARGSPPPMSGFRARDCRGGSVVTHSADVSREWLRGGSGIRCTAVVAGTGLADNGLWLGQWLLFESPVSVSTSDASRRVCATVKFDASSDRLLWRRRGPQPARRRAFQLIPQFGEPPAVLKFDRIEKKCRQSVRWILCGFGAGNGPCACHDGMAMRLCSCRNRTPLLGQYNPRAKPGRACPTQNR